MRKPVYLVLMVALAAGLYLVLTKKPSENAPVVTSEALPLNSAEQAPQLPSEAPATAPHQGDAEHSANSLPAGFGKLSDFTLTNQLGQEFKLADKKGNVLIASFFFTRCEGPCPLMNKKMEALQEKFANDANIKLVSITVDPANDTVPVIKAYSDKFNAHADKWSFLTGSKELINQIMEKEMKLGGSEDIATHSTRFVLIDKEANIKGYFDSASEDEIAKLEVEARLLAHTES